MSTRTDVIEQYFDGFRHSDHERILACLTDDVAWDLPGYRSLAGKEEFDSEIENPEFEGSPELVVDRMIEGADAVVVIGSGEARRRNGDRHRFAYCDVFTFTGDLVSRVESYVVPIPLE
jgi:ketosteroid isomerase-like protein